MVSVLRYPCTSGPGVLEQLVEALLAGNGVDPGPALHHSSRMDSHARQRFEDRLQLERVSDHRLGVVQKVGDTPQRRTVRRRTA